MELITMLSGDPECHIPTRRCPRVLMIIDAPDDLEQLMAPPGLKEACKYSEALYRKTKSVRVRSEAGTDLSYECGEYPVMTQWGFADERGHFDHWGGGHIHTFPNEGSAHGTVVFHLTNDGKLPHDFSFGSRGGGSPPPRRRRSPCRSAACR